MYLSRPPISPGSDKQLAKKPSVALHQGGGNVTTVMVLDEDQVRHPVTKKFTSRYQNQQSSAPSESESTDSTEKGMFTAGKRKGV